MELNDIIRLVDKWVLFSLRNRLAQEFAQGLIPITFPKLQYLLLGAYGSDMGVVVAVGLSKFAAVGEVAPCPNTCDEVEEFPVGAYCFLLSTSV